MNHDNSLQINKNKKTCFYHCLNHGMNGNIPLHMRKFALLYLTIYMVLRNFNFFFLKDITIYLSCGNTYIYIYIHIYILLDNDIEEN
jgi:hypothetical protein